MSAPAWVRRVLAWGTQPIPAQSPITDSSPALGLNDRMWESPVHVVRLFGLIAETDQGPFMFPEVTLHATYVAGDTLRLNVSLCFGTNRVIAVSDRDADNAQQELLDCAKAGDRLGFFAVAACLMPPGDVAECWAGTRTRLGLSP